MTTSRFGEYKSIFSDGYRQAKTHFSKMIESNVALQAKESLNNGYDKCKSVISDSYQQTMTTAYDIAQSEVVSTAKKSINKGYKQCTSVVADSYEKVVLTASEIAESETTKNVRKKLDHGFNQSKSILSESYVKTKLIASEIAESNAAKNTIKSLDNSYDKCKSLGTTIYQKTISGINKVAESKEAIIVKDAVIHQYKECKTIVMDQSQKVTNGASELLGEKNISNIKELYSQAKLNIESVIALEIVIRTKKILKNALSTVFTVHYMFDLGLCLIPGTSSFGMLKSLNKIITLATFIIAVYQSFYQNRSENLIDEKILEFESAIDHANKAISLAEEIFFQAKELLDAAGYGSSNTMDQKEGDINSTSPNPTEFHSNFQSSTPQIFANVILNGIEKSNSVYYTLKLLADFIRVSFIFHFFKNIILTATMIGSASHVYNQHKVNSNAKQKYKILENKLVQLEKILIEIEIKLGTQGQLQEIAKYADFLLSESSPVGIDEIIPQDINLNNISRPEFKESKSTLYIKALFDGAEKASRVDATFQQFLPKTRAIKKIAEMGALLMGVDKSLSDKSKEMFSYNQFNNFTVRLARIQKLLLIAKKIVMQQQVWVAQITEERLDYDITNDQNKIKKDDILLREGTEEMFLADFEDIWTEDNYQTVINDELEDELSHRINLLSGSESSVLYHSAMNTDLCFFSAKKNLNKTLNKVEVSSLSISPSI